MDLHDVIKGSGEHKKIVKSVRVTPTDDKFMRDNKINLNKVVDVSLKELKEKIKKESGAWK